MSFTDSGSQSVQVRNNIAVMNMTKNLALTNVPTRNANRANKNQKENIRQVNDALVKAIRTLSNGADNQANVNQTTRVLLNKLNAMQKNTPNSNRECARVFEELIRKLLKVTHKPSNPMANVITSFKPNNIGHFNINNNKERRNRLEKLFKDTISEFNRANDANIKPAYKAASLILHPNKNPTNKNLAEEYFKILGQKYKNRLNRIQGTPQNYPTPAPTSNYPGNNPIVPAQPAGPLAIANQPYGPSNRPTGNVNYPTIANQPEEPIMLPGPVPDPNVVPNAPIVPVPPPMMQVNNPANITNITNKINNQIDVVNNNLKNNGMDSVLMTQLWSMFINDLREQNHIEYPSNRDNSYLNVNQDILKKFLAYLRKIRVRNLVKRLDKNNGMNAKNNHANTPNNNGMNAKNNRANTPNNNGMNAKNNRANNAKNAKNNTTRNLN